MRTDANRRETVLFRFGVILALLAMLFLQCWHLTAALKRRELGRWQVRIEKAPDKNLSETREQWRTGIFSS